jgi:hypothetical protein
MAFCGQLNTNSCIDGKIMPPQTDELSRQQSGTAANIKLTTYVKKNETA